MDNWKSQLAKSAAGFGLTSASVLTLNPLMFAKGLLYLGSAIVSGGKESQYRAAIAEHNPNIKACLEFKDACDQLARSIIPKDVEVVYCTASAGVSDTDRIDYPDIEDAHQRGLPIILFRQYDTPYSAV